jgi:hypothetical protein
MLKKSIGLIKGSRKTMTILQIYFPRTGTDKSQQNPCLYRRRREFFINYSEG